MSCDSNSYSSKYRPFSVSSPDILHSFEKKQNDEDFKLTKNDLKNPDKFSPNLASFKLSNSNKFSKFKLPQMFNSEFIYSSNNELFHKDSNWMNGVARYFKPILNYINNKNATKDNFTRDNWEIDRNEIEDIDDVRSVIARGSQGVVYLGRFRKINKLVAVKFIKEKNETEIKHLKKLQHPNIIIYYGIITEPYSIVMEYCSKGHLHDKLKNSDFIIIELFVKWTKQIVKGMRYLHEHQIVHRDLKSLNIFINDENDIKIGDFGDCKNVNELSAKMSFAGKF